MKRLKFSYDMQIQFDAPIREHHFTIKCTPYNDERQRIERINTVIEPNYYLSESVDSYGNRCIYGYMPDEHDLFSIHVNGVVRTGLDYKKTNRNDSRNDMYKYPTAIVRPGKEIKNFFESIKFENLNDKLEMAYEIAYRLFNEMSYVSGSTSIETPAEEAFGMRKGVCQDYTHIFISLCQLAKIPARYVVGFMKGEGESHAWAEVITRDGIYAFDPTNNELVHDDYIRVSCGRDYNDCLINNGVFYGNANQSREIKLKVEEM